MPCVDVILLKRDMRCHPSPSHRHQNKEAQQSSGGGGGGGLVRRESGRERERGGLLTLEHRAAIRGWAAGSGTAAPWARIWRRRAGRVWASRPRWPACSPSLSDSPPRSRRQSSRRRCAPGWSWGRTGRPADRSPWWTLGGRTQHNARSQDRRSAWHTDTHTAPCWMHVVSANIAWKRLR